MIDDAAPIRVEPPQKRDRSSHHRLGRALGLTVVAEAWRRRPRGAMLGETGCPLGQGYLFGMPTTQKFLKLAWRGTGSGGIHAASLDLMVDRNISGGY